MNFTVVIPARYASTRLPAKPLRDIAGKTMIQRVYEQASLSDASRVVVATDDQRIADQVALFGGEVCMTSANHPSGTDRLQEVAATLNLAADHIVVNVQGDEPLIPPAVINQVANNLASAEQAGVATLCEPITSVEDFTNANVVKVIASESGLALYFSRAPIPWPRDHFAQDTATLPDSLAAMRHIGIYAYRVSQLNRFVNWHPAPIENIECLEQLRFMWHGVAIHVSEAVQLVPSGVDTEEDLQRVIELVTKR
jgi:3-deoxy-manno-octulosonate cytidylyltransferase (CMP-KDO synthetase)